MQLQGNFFDYFIVYWAGVLVSFTPCVFPVIPLTAGFLGGLNTKGSKLMGFTISLIYVFGLALTYSILAVIAALTGKIFGQIQNNAFIFIGVAIFLIFFGLAMLDVIKLPTIGINIQHKIKTKNIATVVLFGMASGLVIGACTAPILAVLIAYIGSKQNIVHGVSLMFVFSYGVGTSLILVGTFSGLLANMPRSGAWLIGVKQFCGAVLIIAAVYFLIKAGMLL